MSWNCFPRFPPMIAYLQHVLEAANDARKRRFRSASSQQKVSEAQKIPSLSKGIYQQLLFNKWRTLSLLCFSLSNTLLHNGQQQAASCGVFCWSFGRTFFHFLILFVHNEKDLKHTHCQLYICWTIKYIDFSSVKWINRKEIFFFFVQKQCKQISFVEV